ncbi:mercury(II) reductase [Ornithinimicrobium panacihumi]|uniref:mercury(II) reductase n=1 Tax=Ornithinimicrobium panacihumi TaxID=2008449 RepID=UPI003F8AFA0F
MTIPDSLDRTRPQPTGAFDVDLAVIGSGGAAMGAAIEARRRGASAVLIERDVLGGTCVNRGCVPSKALLAAAGARNTARVARHPGVATAAGAVDLAALVEAKEDLVTDLRQTKYVDVAAAWGFGLLAGSARFRDRDTLEVAGSPLRARAYVIATGAGPALPDLPGLGEVDYLTSTTAMQLRELPTSIVVIGGGYVGLEQAQLFAHLGSKVTLVGRLTPHAEPELADVMREVFTDDGITVVEEHAATLARTPDGVRVTTVSGAQLPAAQVLVATGRRPQTTELGLPAAGVATDDAGFVVVDAHQRTSNPRVLAAGDVTGGPQFVYVAAEAGLVAAANALDPAADRSVDYTALPAVTFTRPQLASAGLSERAAREAGFAVDSRVLSLADVPRALVNRDIRGAVKIVADTTSGVVLGVHAAADNAGEMMLAATYAIKAGMTIDQVADTWAPYLTMAESLRLTAKLFRDEMPTSCCA